MWCFASGEKKKTSLHGSVVHTELSEIPLPSVPPQLGSVPPPWPRPPSSITCSTPPCNFRVPILRAPWHSQQVSHAGVHAQVKGSHGVIRNYNILTPSGYGPVVDSQCGISVGVCVYNILTPSGYGPVIDSLWY